MEKWRENAHCNLHTSYLLHLKDIVIIMTLYQDLLLGFCNPIETETRSRIECLEATKTSLSLRNISV